MRSLVRWVLVVLLALGLLPAQATAQGTCSVPFTFQTGDSVSATTLNTIQTTLGQTNMTAACVDDYSASAVIMRTATDPYAGGTESLATSLAGELERLRFVLRHVHNWTFWYSHNEDVDFRHRTLRNHMTTLTGYKELIRSEAHLSSSSTRFHLLTIGLTEYVGGAAHPESVIARFHVNTTTRWQVGIGGDMHVGSTLALHAAGTATHAALFRPPSPGTGVFWPSATQVAVTAGDTEAVRWSLASTDKRLMSLQSTVSHATSLLHLSATLNAGVGESASAIQVTPTFVEAASGTHPTFAGIRIEAFSVTNSAAATTNAAGLYIVGPPTGATNVYAFWVDAGITRLEGAVTGDGTRLQFTASDGTTERMRLTDGGVLALGTTVTTSAGAGDGVLPNNTGELRWVNAAGTNTIDVLSLNSSNNITLNATGTAGRIFLGTNATRTHINVVATASLPAAGAAEDGSIIIEDNGAGDRNFVIYAGGQRFRIDGGASF